LSKLMTVNEVAKELDVEIQFVYRLIQSKELKAFKLNDAPRSHFRIKRIDLIKFIDERKRGN